jgi:hypothetical protein
MNKNKNIKTTIIKRQRLRRRPNKRTTIKFVQKKNKGRGLKKLNTMLANMRIRGKMPSTRIANTKYSMSLWNPELMLKAQLPRQFGLSTLPINRHLTVPITANASGLFWLAFQPYILTDGSTTNTTLFLNNDNSYTGTAIGTAGALGLALSLSISPSTVASYSLVSASLIIQPQSNWTTITGKLGGASLPFQAQYAPAGSASYGTVAYQTISNIEILPHYAEADLQASESLRFIYTVCDNHDLQKYIVDAAVSTSIENETTFMAYCSGAPAGAKFNLEIYLNYEITTLPGSSFSGLSQPCGSIEDPLLTNTKLLNCKPDPVVTSIKGAITRNMGATQLGLLGAGTIANKAHVNRSFADESSYFNNPQVKSAFNAKYGHDILGFSAMHENHQNELDEVIDALGYKHDSY